MLDSADLEREADAPDLAGLGEQALDRELEVVDLLEREVHALGDAADDQADHRLEVARQRGHEVDALWWLVTRLSDGPSPTTRSSRIRQASCPGATRVGRLVELELECRRLS